MVNAAGMCRDLEKSTGRFDERGCGGVAAGVEITWGEERDEWRGRGRSNKKTRRSWAFNGGPNGWQAPESHLHCLNL